MLTYILFTLRNDLFVDQISSTIHHIFKKAAILREGVSAFGLHETLLMMLKVQGALRVQSLHPNLTPFLGAECHLVFGDVSIWHLSLGKTPK